MSFPKFDGPGPPPPKDFDWTKVEELSYHGFSLEEICEIIQIDSFWFVKGKPFYESYRRGFLKSQLELRQRIFIDAKHGSSPAQAMAKKILDDAQFKMDGL